MKKIDDKWIAGYTHPRNKEGYKHSFGHVLIIAGRKGKLGAAIIVTRAALHNGCGDVLTGIIASLCAQK